MIVDSVDNWSAYANILPGLPAAFRFLVERAKDVLQVGEYEIDGRNVYALVNRYVTVPIEGAPFETHYKHVDLHYIIAGEEIIGWTPLKGLKARSEYDPKEDVIIYDPPAESILVKMNPGYFALFLPSDSHSPGKHRDVASEVHKIVIKIRLEPGAEKR